MPRSDAPADRMPAVAFRDVSKAFGPVVANRGLTFTVGAGTVHGIIGENGAGKSTAMKMLYGMQAPDAGEILVDGEAVAFRSSRDAMRRRIGMVHQHFMLAGALSAWENVVLGQEPASPWQRWVPAPLRALNGALAKKRIAEVASFMGEGFDWDRPVAQLPVSAQQKLEIARLLLGDARIMILDEPTAVLTPQEAQDLFRILRALRDQGRTIILITHKLKEVMALTDRVTVMRQGEVVAERDTAATSVEELGTLMVGRTVTRATPRAAVAVTGAPVLTLAGVSVAPHGGKRRLADMDLTVAGGEIVGIAGVQGSGQKALLDLLAEPKRYFKANARFHEGEKLHAHGSLRFGDEDATGFDNRRMRAAGLGFVAEDRHHESVLLDADLRENFLMGHQGAPAFSQGPLVARGALDREVGAAISAYDVRPQTPGARMRALSGGNQQKVVVARELWAAPKLLVAAEPTRGVDISAIEIIHQKIRDARDRGAGVLLVSSDLDELMALADRILVMCDGNVVRALTRDEFSEAALGVAMGGAHHA